MTTIALRKHKLPSPFPSSQVVLVLIGTTNTSIDQVTTIATRTWEQLQKVLPSQLHNNTQMILAIFYFLLSVHGVRFRSSCLEYIGEFCLGNGAISSRNIVRLKKCITMLGNWKIIQLKKNLLLSGTFFHRIFLIFTWCHIRVPSLRFTFWTGTTE